MRRVACLGAIICSLVVGAPVQAAGRPIVYTSKTVTVGARHVRTIQVPCPRGRVAVGGGITASSPSVLLTRSSTPTGGGFSPWTVAAHNLTRRSHSVTAYAACLAFGALPPGTVASTSIVPGTGPNGGTTALTASCGGGAALGGGFDLQSTDPSIRIQASKPTVGDDGWTIEVFNPTTASVPLNYQVICISGPVTMSYANATKDVAAHKTATAAVACPQGQVASGGFDMALNGTGAISASRPTGLGASPPGKGWAATGHAGAAPEPLAVFADCLSV